MAADFLENPRRAPRARVRCPISVSSGVGPPLRAFSEDVGPYGCLLVAPRTYPMGSMLWLELHAEEAPEPLRAVGTVAWASEREPWRVGLAYGESFHPAATRFFDRLVAHRPGLVAWRNVPDRIPLDAQVWLAPPPRLVVDFSADEVALLRVIGSGATLQEVRGRLRDGWAVAQRSFFSLLASGFVTLSRGGSVPYANWAELLRRLESELAVAGLGSPSAAPTRWVPAMTSTAQPAPTSAASPPTRSVPAASAPGTGAASSAPVVPASSAPTGTVPAMVPPVSSARSAPGTGGNDGSAGLDLEIDLEARSRAPVISSTGLQDWPDRPERTMTPFPRLPPEVPTKGRG